VAPSASPSTSTAWKTTAYSACWDSRWQIPPLCGSRGPCGPRRSVGWRRLTAHRSGATACPIDEGWLVSVCQSVLEDTRCQGNFRDRHIGKWTAKNHGNLLGRTDGAWTPPQQDSGIILTVGWRPDTPRMAGQLPPASARAIYTVMGVPSNLVNVKPPNASG
jgi:hypothetical protein